MKQEQVSTGLEASKKAKILLVWIGAILLIWGIVFYKGLLSAISIWYSSDVFNHCLFVIPGSMYLIYLKKDELLSRPVVPNYWVLVLIVPLVVLYAVGLAGDVQLFMHAAMFTALPLIVWAVIGTRAASTILFPLFFLLFCIPVGEELVPYLQEIAATTSVALLEFSGIPVFRSGLYIEIPRGRFLVAEACSGISFFIASLVIGCLYSYLNIVSHWRRAVFVLLSIVFPIAANAIRVYGIIVIAHVSDMQYAVGADHLIYGWFFFAFVIVCLIAIGEWIRESRGVSARTLADNKTVTIATMPNMAKPVTGVALVLVLGAVWFMAIGSALPATRGKIAEFSNTEQIATIPKDALLQWSPTYRTPTAQRFIAISSDTLPNNLVGYQAIYVAGDAEMITSRNRLYDQSDWTLVQADNVSSDEFDYRLEVISNPRGEIRLLASWFVVGDQTYDSKTETKIAQIITTLAGKAANGGVVAITLPTEQANLAADKAALIALLKELYHVLSKQVEVNTTPEQANLANHSESVKYA